MTVQMSKRTKTVSDEPWIRFLKIFAVTGVLLNWVVMAIGYFPYNLYIEIIAVGAWGLVGLKWRDNAIIFQNAVVLGCCLVSLLTYTPMQ